MVLKPHKHQIKICYIKNYANNIDVMFTRNILNTSQHEIILNTNKHFDL